MNDTAPDTATETALDPAIRVKLARNAEILTEELGQRRSMELGLPLDARENPLPWYTYPAIEFLGSFDFAGCRVFEYGGGNSTRYWLGQGATVHTVDHDPNWVAHAGAQAHPRQQVELRTEREGYVGALAAAGGLWDVIVIDGRWRLQCAAIVPAHLNPGGLIILDNSDWYPQTAALLRGQGFFQFDHSGFGPINNYTWSTSFFINADTRLQKNYANPQAIGSQVSNGDNND